MNVKQHYRYYRFKCKYASEKWSYDFNWRGKLTDENIIKYENRANSAEIVFCRTVHATLWKKKESRVVSLDFFCM